MIATATLLLTLISDLNGLPTDSPEAAAMAAIEHHYFQGTTLYEDKDRATVQALLFERSCTVKLEHRNGTWIVTHSVCVQAKED